MLTSEDALVGEKLRIEGWYGSEGPQQTISFIDPSGELKQDVAEVVESTLANVIRWDEGRYEGELITSDLVGLAMQPSVSVIRFNPVFEIENKITESFEASCHYFKAKRE